MSRYWSRPIYDLKTLSGKKILIDVTSSVAPGLPPTKVLSEKLIPFLMARKVRRILDFGAGALRHTLPLLENGFQVCAVEFEEGFQRSGCSKALIEARKYPNFSALVWPKDFIRDRRKFDAALLIYVIQVMPIERERDAVIKYIYKKLRDDSYLFYASRYNQIEVSDEPHQILDGYYRWPKRKHHSFYREFTTEETHEMFSRHKFKRIRSLGERGNDQMFVYVKGKGTWI